MPNRQRDRLKIEHGGTRDTRNASTMTITYIPTPALDGKDGVEISFLAHTGGENRCSWWDEPGAVGKGVWGRVRGKNMRGLRG